MIPGFWKRSHVINSPIVKELNLEIVSQWHGISRIDVTMFLTYSASPDEFLGVFIHGWPEKPTLPNL
jgi:hypothetical protein